MGGSLTMKNGKIDKFLFGGGYAQASVASSTTDNFNFYYYNQDHLGNIREVVDASGNVQQITNYYPFGAPYADASASANPDFQPYKYNCKELDKMHGLNTYDYGARQHDPILGRWDRIDPLCEKYYNVSPYAYCSNRPTKNIDPDGKEVIDMLPTNTMEETNAKNKFFERWHFKNSSILLMGHGGDNGESFCTDNNPITKKIYADSPYGMAYFLEDNSQTWNYRSIASDKVELVLFSCETGSYDCLAEELSKQEDFQDIRIFAPSDVLNIKSNGSISIDNCGVWREYLNGEVINEYPGNTLPGTQEFDSSTLLKKTSQDFYWQK